MTATDLRDALNETRGHQGTVVIVVAAIPHADLPGAGVWWDVAPAEVSEIATVPPLRAEYESRPPDPAVVRMSPVSPTPLNGGALADAVRRGQPRSGTFIGMASPGQRRGVRRRRVRLGPARPRARRRR